MVSSTLLKVTFLLFGSQWTCQGAPSCPAGWNLFNRKCFKWPVRASDQKPTTQSTWLVARDYCIGEGGDLAKPDIGNLEAFAKFLKDNKFEDSNQIYLGGSDGITGGEWRWNDGTKIDLPQTANGTDNRKGWKVNQPDNNNFTIAADDEDCLYMDGDNAVGNNRMGDWKCSDARYFVCELKMVTFTLPIRQGYVSFNPLMYYVPTSHTTLYGGR